MVGKVAGGVLLLLTGVAAAYLLRPLLVASVFYTGFSPAYFVVLGFGLLGQSGFGLMIFPGLPVAVLLALVTSGIVGGLVLSLFERATIGLRAARPHIFGMMKAGIPVVALLFYTREGVPETELAMGLVAFVPVLHLITVWRALDRSGMPQRSRLTPWRALALAMGAYGVVYVVGAVQFVPEYGGKGLVWPQVVVERIDVASPQAAEQQRGDLAATWSEVPLWLRVDRAMTAVLGTEWALPTGLRSPRRFSPPRCAGPGDLL